MSSVTYVLSAHGQGSTKKITLPKNFFVHTYVPEGKKIYCSVDEPNRICRDPRHAKGHYNPGTPYTNDILWADKNKEFYSGVKDCITGNVIFNIDALGENATTDIETVITNVNSYHMKTYPGYVAHLHCLYCRDSTGGKRTRRTRRKTLRTRRRR